MFRERAAFRKRIPDRSGDIGPFPMTREGENGQICLAGPPMKPYYMYLLSTEKMNEEKSSLEKVRSGLKSVRRVSRTESQVGRYVHLGLTFALSILLFLYGGYRLDIRLGTLPLFTLIGTFLGGAGGFLYIYRALVTGGGRDHSK